MLSARIFFDTISTTGTMPVTAIGVKSSTEYLTFLFTCGTTTSSEV